MLCPQSTIKASQSGTPCLIQQPTLANSKLYPVRFSGIPHGAFLSSYVCPAHLIWSSLWSPPQYRGFTMWVSLSVCGSFSPYKAVWELVWRLKKRKLFSLVSDNKSDQDRNRCHCPPFHSPPRSRDSLQWPWIFLLQDTLSMLLLIDM